MCRILEEKPLVWFVCNLIILILIPFILLHAHLIWIWGLVCKICWSFFLIATYCWYFSFLLFLKNVELQWFLLCIVTILGKCSGYFHLRSCICGFEERKSDHLGSLLNHFFVCSKSLHLNIFLMVGTGSSYNRVVSILKILYCVEGVPLWQQIISLFGCIAPLVSSYLVLHVTGASSLTILLAFTALMDFGKKGIK